MNAFLYYETIFKQTIRHTYIDVIANGTVVINATVLYISVSDNSNGVVGVPDIPESLNKNYNHKTLRLKILKIITI